MSFIDIQFATEQTSLPNKKDFQKWVDAALTKEKKKGTVSIRIVDELEMTELNTRFRQKTKPTNVLSFPCPLPFKDSGNLGDIVICAPVIEKEALTQQKKLSAHWAHMIIHGVLHLLGYDHVKDDEAMIMENLEVDILESLGFSNPYRVNS